MLLRSHPIPCAMALLTLLLVYSIVFDRGPQSVQPPSPGRERALPSSATWRDRANNAVDDCDAAALSSLLGRDRTRIHDRAASGETLLHQAVGQGCVPIVKLLLEKGARSDLAVRGELGDTPLHLAARHGHLELVELLLAEGADPEAENNQRATPLLLACSSEEPDDHRIADLLLKRGAKYDVRSAACRGDLKRVRQALDNDPELARQPIWGWPVSWKVTQKNALEVARLLLDRHAAIGEAEFLHNAVSNQNRTLVEWLLNRGVDVNRRWENQQSALHEAVSGSDHDLEIVRLLIDHGADVNPKSRPLDATPLDIAELCHFRGAVTLLRKRGARSNPRFRAAVKEQIDGAMDGLGIPPHRRRDIGF